jgi:putative hydroxymethylpyrimidine transport system permease protein
MRSTSLLRPLTVCVGLLAAWQLVVWLTGLPPFILPDPARVADALVERGALLAEHAATTFVEIVAGLVLGTVVGAASALAVSYFEPMRRWLLPILVVSQAIPVFALAPILVLWLGYGLASKIAMAVLIIYFPVTAAFYDGLRRTDPGWLDLARVMNGSRWQTLRRVRLPAALPALASGLRVAAAVAPIGAIIGEWVGSSAGLGYLMLQANARVQIDAMFAALIVLAVIALAVYFTLDAVLKRALPWQPDTAASDT